MLVDRKGTEEGKGIERKPYTQHVDDKKSRFTNICKLNSAFGDMAVSGVPKVLI